MKKRHVSTLTNTAKGVTALLLLGSIVLLCVAAAALVQDFSFFTICFFLLMIFAVVVAVRVTMVQCKTGVLFWPDRLEFHLEDDPLLLSYHEIENVELLDNGEAPKSGRNVLLGAQLMFHLKDGGLRIVPIPKLRKSVGKRIIALTKQGQERGL